MSVTTRRRGRWALAVSVLAVSVLALAGCGSATAAHPAATVTVTAPASNAPGDSAPPAAAASSAPPPASVSPAPPPGIGSGPGYPVDGPAADITSTGGLHADRAGRSSVGNRYYTVHTTLVVTAPGEITINTADVEVLGPDGSEIGSLQVMPVSASSSTISAPLVVTTGTVPFTGVAEQRALSGQFSSACKVVSVSYAP